MSSMSHHVAPVIMDAKKFVKTINNGASARLKFFEESISKLGAKVGKNLRLTSLDANNVIYEDIDKNEYYIANIYKNNRGKIELNNIRPIQIVEENKATQYKKNIKELVESICNDDIVKAEKIFSKIESQRFRSRVIPESGWITLRDGVARHIPVSTRIVKEDHINSIIKLFSEAVSDNIELSEGRIIKGVLNESNEKFIVPINEYTRRRLIARQMKETAKDAYKSTAFQDLIFECASLICENRIADAIKVVATFLKEEQEFCLLESNEVRTLIENTLATRNQFNSMLAHDVASLFYKTNLKVNRDDIIESWRKLAQKTQSAALLSNVDVLSESNNFENDHDKFINLIFNEDTDVKQARAKAYRTALRVIASTLPELESDDGQNVSSSLAELNELIEKLSEPEVDDNVLMQAEELLAGISDSLIDNVQDLENFDTMPGYDHEELDTEDHGELISLPEVGEEGEEEESPETGELGGEEFGVEPPEEGEEEREPPMESLKRFTPVENMNASQLKSELENWKVHGDLFLEKYGYDQCNNDMRRYIRRCIELGPKTNYIREQFENIRDTIIETGNTTIKEEYEDDNYAKSVTEALNTPTKLRMNDLQGSGGVVGSTLQKSDGRSFGGSKAGFHSPQRGSGVARKGLVPSDGRKGEKSTPGSAKGSLRMDDLQGNEGVQSSELQDSDGRSGLDRRSMARESTAGVGRMSKGDPALNKKGYESVGLSMGKDFQGTGETGVLPKVLHKSDGSSGDGVDAADQKRIMHGLDDPGLSMDEFQGSDGVADSKLDDYPYSKKAKTDLFKAKRGGDMSGMQGNDGVAESITMRIAELISEMDKQCESCKCDPCECDDDNKLVKEADSSRCLGCKQEKCVCDNKCEHCGYGICKCPLEEGKKGENCPSCECDPCECKGGAKVCPSCECDPCECEDKGSSMSEGEHGPCLGCKQEECVCDNKCEHCGYGVCKCPLTEDKVAAFVGEPENVASTVDKILGSMGPTDLGSTKEVGSDFDKDTEKHEKLRDEEEDKEEEDKLTDEEIEELESALDEALSDKEEEGHVE